jgi:hypothetical protein
VKHSLRRWLGWQQLPLQQLLIEGVAAGYRHQQPALLFDQCRSSNYRWY